MAEAVEKVEPEAVEKVEPEAVEKVDAKHLLFTSFGFSSLISRLDGTLPGLVGIVEVDNKIAAFPLLLFSDCVPPCFTRSLSCNLLSPTSGAKSNAEKRLAVGVGAYSVATLGLQDLPGATL